MDLITMLRLRSIHRLNLTAWISWDYWALPIGMSMAST